MEKEDQLKKYKEKYLGKDKSNRALFKQTLNPEKFIESLKKNDKLIKENESIFDEIIKNLKNF